MRNVNLFVKGSKDDVELPRRKRVKVEQEPEEVSTVTSGKVVVSTMGSARIVGRSRPTADKKTRRKLLAKTTTVGTTMKVGAVLKKKSSSERPDSAVKKHKLTQKQKDTAQKTSKSLKHSASQQPLRKKKRSL